MNTIQAEETRRIAMAGAVCAAIGAAVATMLILTAPPIGFRLVILAAIVLGAISTKTASAVATFTGWILLLPVACTPLAMFIALIVAGGASVPNVDNPALFLLGVPSIAYFATACVIIKMD